MFSSAQKNRDTLKLNCNSTSEHRKMLTQSILFQNCHFKCELDKNTEMKELPMSDMCFRTSSSRENEHFISPSHIGWNKYWNHRPCQGTKKSQFSFKSGGKQTHSSLCLKFCQLAQPFLQDTRSLWPYVRCSLLLGITESLGPLDFCLVIVSIVLLCFLIPVCADIPQCHWELLGATVCFNASWKCLIYLEFPFFLNWH